MMSFIPNLYKLAREYVNSTNIDYNKFKDILEFIPENIINQYELLSKATTDRYIYVNIQKGMYGLP